MTTEWRILNASGVSRRKHTTLQHGVAWWLAFKVAVLERGLIAQGLDVATFRARALVHLRSKGPSHLRGHSATAKRLRSDCVRVWVHYYAVLCQESSPLQAVPSELAGGLGLCPRRPQPWTDLVQHAVGYVCDVSESEYAVLLRDGYPSLLAPCFILFGPLALVNHSCKTDVCFGAPSNCADDASVFEGMREVRIGRPWSLKRRRLDGELVRPEDGEVLVNYGHDKCRTEEGALCVCFTSL